MNYFNCRYLNELLLRYFTNIAVIIASLSCGIKFYVKLVCFYSLQFLTQIPKINITQISYFRFINLRKFFPLANNLGCSNGILFSVFADVIRTRQLLNCNCSKFCQGCNKCSVASRLNYDGVP